MRNKRIPILILLALTAAAALSAETLRLSLEDSVALALKQNLSLENARIDLSLENEKDNYSWNFLIPDLSANADLSRTDSLFGSTASSGDPWSFSAGLNASLSLNPAGALVMSSSRLSLESQEISYQSDENALKLSVSQQYYYLLAYRENLDLRLKNLELAEKRYLQTQINFNNGLASRLDVLEARSSYESLRPDYTDARTSYSTGLMSFKKLLGLDLDQEIEFTGTLEVTLLDLDGDSLISTYLNDRLDVQSAVNALIRLENQLKSVRRTSLAPTLSLGARWNNSLSDLSADGEWTGNATVSLSLSVPLSSYIKGSSESLDITDAEQSILKQQNQLKETLSAAEQEIRTLLMELEGSRENIAITEMSVDLARENYEMVDAAFKTGAREILDVEDAQNKLFSAQQDLIISKYGYLKGLLELENALNTVLQES